jgi:hypothetical protein
MTFRGAAVQVGAASLFVGLVIPVGKRIARQHAARDGKPQGIHPNDQDASLHANPCVRSTRTQTGEQQ